jgi:hypothetical protein
VNPVVTIDSPDVGLILDRTPPTLVLTDNDVDDIVAYLKLLGPNR